MYRKKYLINLAKIACDAFAMPDLYTYLLFRGNYKNYYFIAPSSLFVDIILGFHLGTFFLVDLTVYYIWKKATNFTKYANSAIVLYSLRYFALYLLGMSSFNIFNQLFYCLFFSFAFKLVRG